MWWVVDAHYREDGATAAGVGLGALTDAGGEERLLVSPDPPAQYEPGAFSARELPLLRALLDGLPIAGVVVDGYAWLGPERPGLGANLHRALGVPVIGVAKTAFAGAERVAVPVRRGDAAHPLFVSAAGLDGTDAAARVASMHGPWRLPNPIKRADRLCRDLGFDARATRWRRLLTVEDRFAIGGRGLLVVPEPPLDAIDGGDRAGWLRRPDGSIGRTRVSLVLPFPAPGRPLLWAVRLPDATRADVPVGTELWVEDP